MATQTEGAKDRTQGCEPGRNAKLLEEAITHHESKLRHQASANSNLTRDVEDALQEAYALFLAHYDGTWPALPYLMTTVKRCAWQIGRKSSRQREVSPDRLLPAESDTDFWELVGNPAPNTAERVERDEELERQREALRQLKPDEQKALILLGAGLSYKEIGELNAWTYTKVNRCVNEGRARLRQLLDS